VLGKMSLVKFPVKFLVKFLTRCFVIKSDQKNSTENSTDDFTTHPGIPYFTLSKSTPNQSPFTSSKAQLSGGRMQIALGPSVPLPPPPPQPLRRHPSASAFDFWETHALTTSVYSEKTQKNTPNNLTQPQP
jgi:hypothetical protein